jgi:hypothetical protein
MNRLLKFKEFSELMEGLVFENAEKDPWKTNSKDKPYWDAYRNLVSEKPPKNTKPNELIRASFGVDSPNTNEISDETRENINKIFKSVEGSEPTEIIKYMPGEVNVKGSHGSGDYSIYKVKTEKNPEGYWITNNDSSKKVKIEGEKKLFSPKDLTPGELGLNTQDYLNKTLLAAEAKRAIKGFVQDKLHLDFILKLIDICEKPDQYNFSTDLKNSIDDTVGSYRVDYDFENFDKILELGNLGNIQNDFGEVLGALFLFNLVNPEGIGGGVEYPPPTQKLVDFFFNGKGVSSKGGKTGGAAATITEYIALIKKSIDAGWIMTPSQEEVYNTILKPMSVGESENKERAPRRWFGSSARGSEVFSGIVTCLEAANLPGWLMFKKEFGLKGGVDINRDDIVDCFDRLGKSGNLSIAIQTFCNQVSNISDPRTKCGTTNLYYEKIVRESSDRRESKEKWEEFVNDLEGSKGNKKSDESGITAEFLKLIIGFVLYPCASEFIQHVKTKETVEGKTYLQTISEMINHAVNVNQLNLTIDIKRDSILFEMSSSKESTYTMIPLNDYTTVLNNNIKIKKK